MARAKYITIEFNVQKLNGEDVSHMHDMLSDAMNLCGYKLNAEARIPDEFAIMFVFKDNCTLED